MALWLSATASPFDFKTFSTTLDAIARKGTLDSLSQVQFVGELIRPAMMEHSYVIELDFQFPTSAADGSNRLRVFNFCVALHFLAGIFHGRR